MTDIKNMKQRADDSGYFVTDYIKREDTISRQAAIEAVDECTKLKITDDFYTVYTEDMKDMIADIPTADVRENVKGKWIDGKVKHIKNGELRNVRECSECGSSYFVYDNYNSVDEIPNFCPNCGADMRGEA